MAKIAKTKSEFSACITNTDISRHTLLESSSSKPTIGVPSSNASLTIRDTALIAQRRITNAPRCIDASPSRSVGVSVYLDGNFSSCDSLKCQEFDCDDNEEVSSAVNSIEGKSSNSFCISEDLGKPGLFFKELNLLNALFSLDVTLLGTMLPASLLGLMISVMTILANVGHKTLIAFFN